MAGKEIYIGNMIDALQGSMDQLASNMTESVNLLTQLLNITGLSVSNFVCTGSTFDTKIKQYFSKAQNDYYAKNATVNFISDDTVQITAVESGTDTTLSVLIYAPADTVLTGTGSISNAAYNWGVSVDGSLKAHNTTSEEFSINISAGWHKVNLYGYASPITAGQYASFYDLALGGEKIFKMVDEYNISSNVVTRAATSAGEVDVYVVYYGTLGVTVAQWITASLSANISSEIDFEFAIHDHTNGALILSSKNKKDFDIASLLKATGLIFKLRATYDPDDPGTFEYGGFAMRYV